jgi:hypothetical protein
MEGTQELRYCVGCKAFIDVGNFGTKQYRNYCRTHFNERHNKSHKEKWAQNPIERKANTIWQIANNDSKKTFHLKMLMKPSQVLQIIKSKGVGLDDDVRLVPIDPLKPLSMTNYCMTDARTKFITGWIWRKVHNVDDYKFLFDPRCKKPIYARSHDEEIVTE